MIGFLDSDLRAIMEAGDFSERVIFDPAGANAPLMGMMNRPIREVVLADGAGPTRSSSLQRELAITISKSSLPRKPERGDVFSVGSRLFKTTKIISDGHGMLTISLRNHNE